MIDYIIKRFAIVRYIILMPSITLLPINQAKILDLDQPIPTDIGVEINHISDGWTDIQTIPSPEDVNLPGIDIPSAADAWLPTPTETPGTQAAESNEIEYSVAT